MPKIVTREYDLTKAGTLPYANFTVVVPGRVSENADLSVFDDNGVYECSSAEDFVKYIGKVPEIRTEPIAPVLENAPAYMKKYTEQEFNDKKDQLYTWKVDTAGKIKSVGYLVWENPNSHKFVKLDRAKEFVADYQYAEVKPGNEGKDIEHVSYGNQLAYELLELGYTVLYKKVDVEASMTGDNFWEALKDRSAYDFRYITTGGYYNKDAYECISKIATFKNEDYILDHTKDIYSTGRGDCIALLDVNETDAILTAATPTAQVSAIKEEVNKYTMADRYSAIFMPKVIYDRKDNAYENNILPATFHYLACGARSLENGYAEWYANAGYARGLGKYKVAGTTIKIGDLVMNALQPRVVTGENVLEHAVNPIIFDHGTYYVWGNRTAAKPMEYKPGENAGLKARHFLNIRQLCCTLKKEIYRVNKTLTFDPNSDILWNNFCAKLRPMLEKMKADQGISDYKFIKEAKKAKGLMTAKIRIVPIEAVEDFDISITLEDSISGIVTGIEEADAD